VYRYFRSRKRFRAGISQLREKLETAFDERYAVPSFGKDVIEIASARGLLMFDGSFVHHKDCPETLRSLGVDIVLVASFSEILPRRVLEAPKVAAINMHPALLPSYRGGFPEFSAICNGEHRSGVTYHLMEEKFDVGNLLLQRELEINTDETTLYLKERLAQLAVEAIPDLFELIEKGNLRGTAQDRSQVSYCRRTKDFARIDGTKSMHQIRCLINACYDVEAIGRPYFLFNGRKLFVLSHGPEGFPFRANDGVITFDAVRFNHKIYRGEALQRLQDTMGPSST